MIHEKYPAAGLHAKFGSYTAYYNWIQEKQNAQEHRRFMSALKDCAHADARSFFLKLVFMP